MSNNEIPNDFFGFEAAFKKISDAWNEGLEQAKLQSDCKTRRFYLTGQVKGVNRHDGVVFPSGDVVVRDSYYSNIQVFPSLDVYTDHYRASRIQWIDAEPEGWHFDPEGSK